MRDQNVWELPGDPALRQAAIALRDAEQWAIVYDDDWRIVWMSEAQAKFEPEWRDQSDYVRLHALAYPESWFWASNRQYGLDIGGMILADTPGGKDALRKIAVSEVREFLDDVVPDHHDVIATRINGRQMNDVEVTADATIVRLRDPAGKFLGAIYIQKPGGSAYTLSNMTAMISPKAIAQMESVSSSARRPAAILCADLDGSTPLSRRLSTANYFRLTRRWVFSADRCIVEAGGLVGRHAGDGVTAFFLAESLGSESAAAKACILAARSIQQAASQVAERSDLIPDDLVTRFGLHWGSTLYVGAINTQGRFEVTAMGDQVNEAARIEACATGGRTLASKELVERVSSDDARMLGLQIDQIRYVALGELSTATEKARRDAPALAVCDV